LGHRYLVVIYEAGHQPNLEKDESRPTKNQIKYIKYYAIAEKEAEIMLLQL
jgi:hypothetical protein